MILLHFRTLSDNQLSEKVFLHGCQRFIPFACRPILRMNFVLKKNLHFFRTLSDQFWQCGKFLSAGLSKLHFTCRYDQFDGTFFLSKKCFLSVSDIGQKTSGWLSNFLNAEIESSFYVPNGLVWRKTTFFLEKKRFFNPFWTLSDIQPSGKSFSAGFFKIAFYVSMGTFWWNLNFLIVFLLFLDNEQNISGLLDKILRHGCQSCILRVQRISLKEKSFFEKKWIVLITFGRWATTSFLKIIFGRVVNLHFKCS